MREGWRVRRGDGRVWRDGRRVKREGGGWRVGREGEERG